MGYTTTFTGSFSVTPPLNEHEISYLRDFAGTRRMRRQAGPYYATDDGQFGQSDAGGVLDFNTPPEGQPGLWCQWVPTDDGTAIEWDGGEKFYDAPEWLAYLIAHFLAPEAFAQGSTADPRLAHFTFDHELDGTVDAQGDDPDDRWRLRVVGNVVRTLHAYITYES